MTEELSYDTVAVDYCETLLSEQGISPRLQNFIEDMQKAICYVDNCDYKMDECRHRRLAHDLMRAAIDYHASLLEKKNQTVAANILRSEM